MNHLRRYCKSEGDMINFINRYVHTKGKEVIIVSNIIIDQDSYSDLNSIFILIVFNEKYLKITSSIRLIRIILLQMVILFHLKMKYE